MDEIEAIDRMQPLRQALHLHERVERSDDGRAIAIGQGMPFYSCIGGDARNFGALQLASFGFFEADDADPMSKLCKADEIREHLRRAERIGHSVEG